MTLTSDDRKWLLENLASKKDLKDSESRLRQELEASESRIKKEIKAYIHEGVDAVIEGVDNLLQDKDYDGRIVDLEKLHPHGTHAS